MSFISISLMTPVSHQRVHLAGNVDQKEQESLTSLTSFFQVHSLVRQLYLDTLSNLYSSCLTDVTTNMNSTYLKSTKVKAQLKEAEQVLSNAQIIITITATTPANSKRFHHKQLTCIKNIGILMPFVIPTAPTEQVDHSSQCNAFVITPFPNQK